MPSVMKKVPFICGKREEGALPYARRASARASAAAMVASSVSAVGAPTLAA
jgi:hypothetical protein